MIYIFKIWLDYTCFREERIMANVTIKDIAKRCHVGVSTVSRAINNHPDINPETKELIMNTIKELNYIPNNSARFLSRTHSKAIAVLVKGIRNTFFSELIPVIENECHELKHSCIIQYVAENENELEVAITLAKEKRLKGIIFLGGSFSHPKNQLQQLEIPYVLSTVGALDESIASVSVDDEEESYKMTKYLLSLNHKRIAIICGPKEETSISILRLMGYRKALEEQNMTFDSDLVCHMDMNDDCYSFETGYKLTKKLLERTDFTALYAASDMLAIGACRALKERGISVPDDCSVAGFDGLEVGDYYIPTITTIVQPVEDIAKASTKLLFDMIEGKEGPRQMLFKGELLKRESTQQLEADLWKKD